MNKWVKRTLVSGAVMMSALALTACGNNNASSGGGDNGGKKTVTMYMPGETPKNIDAITKKANTEIQKKYPDIQVKMTFIGWGDYDQKYNVMVTSGDSYDLAFAKNYTANAQKGVYADMTDLLKTTGKEAYDAVDPTYWKGMTINNKIYGFPVNANIYGQNMATFNGDFVKKYNIDINGVHDYATMEAPLEAFHKQNPGVAGFAIGQGFKANLDGYDFPLGNSLPFVIDESGKDTQVRNAYDVPAMRENLATLHKFYQKGYIPKDAATSATQYNLQDDTWFIRQETQGPFDYGDTALINAAGGKNIVSKPLTTPYKTTAQTQVAVWSISKTSKHKKEAMQVLNELNTNPKVLNNIVWGVEGTQWKFTNEKEGKIKTTDKYKPNYFIGAWMMGNNGILYTQDSVTKEMIEKRDQGIKDAKVSANLGFNPDVRSLKSEITNISNVMSKYLDILNTGTADPVPTIEKMDKELKGAGYDKVAKELQKQYDAFLKANK